MTFGYTDRLPPQSLDAEQSVLGSCLLSTKAVATVLGRVHESDFYREDHRRVFEAVRGLFDSKSPVDHNTLADELARRNTLEQIGGKAYIYELSESVPTAAHAAYYCDIVAEKAALRRLIDQGGDLIARAYEQEQDADTITRETVAALLHSKKISKHEPRALSSYISDELERVADQKSVPHMRFGIKELDKFCGGLEGGDVGFISGVPGAGKTALVHQVALAAARDWGPVLVFSLEVSGKVIARRSLARESKMSYREVRDAGMWVNGIFVPFQGEDLEAISRAASRLDERSQCIWVDSHSYNLDAIVATAHEWYARHHIRAVVIDYLQLVEYRQATKRNLEVEAITRAVKNRIAVDLDLPTLAVSSLTKEGMNRQGGSGTGDLAESGSLGYSASLIAILERDNNAPWNDDKRPIKFKVVKCRNDRMGEVDLTFHPARFVLTARDADPDEEQEAIAAPEPVDAVDPFADGPIRGTAELPLSMASDYVGATSHYAERY